MSQSSKVAIYTRVSTNNQSDDLQLERLKQYCSARGWQIFDIYRDKASGAKRSRPELDRMMQEASDHRFDTVLVWKFDRFARSLSHLIQALEIFESLKIRFISLSDNVDLSTASGRLMFQIVGAMAEFERSLIKERVIAGIGTARKKGVKLGRPRRFVRVSEIESLRKQSKSWSEISREMKVPLTTVKRAARIAGVK